MGFRKEQRPVLFAEGLRFPEGMVGAVPSLVGSVAALDLDPANAAVDAGFDWPAYEADDLFLIAASISSTRVSATVLGAEVTAITAAAVGNNLANATSIGLSDINSNTVRIRIGRTAAGDVLAQSAAADDDVRLVVYRLAGI